MNKKYVNPPIIEAICEFRFPQESGWDMTIPGLFYEKIKDDFPLKEQRFIKEIELRSESKGIEQRMQTIERILFLNNEKKIFMQISKNILAINCLKPYPSWSKFKPIIEKAFRSFIDILGNIQKIEKIALHYVNKIEIPKKSFELEDYFEFRPFLGPNMPQDYIDFITGCVLPFMSNRDLCRLRLTGAVPENANNTALILDLIYYLREELSIKADDALSWVDNAHGEIEHIFEGCITNNLRQIFKEIK